MYLLVLAKTAMVSVTSTHVMHDAKLLKSIGGK